MRNNHIAAIVLMGILASSLAAEELIPKKTVAIVYEEGKTPDALFHQSLGYFKKVVETGELKSAELGTAKIFGEVIDIQTATDNATTARYERDIALAEIRKSIESSNMPYSRRFTILPTNLLFGDKSLGFVVNPYRGCYVHDFLAKGLEQTAFKIVDASNNPDITMTIGIDACMSENEYKEYIQKNTALKIKNNPTVSNNSSGIGNDLIHSGSSVQLGTPTSGGNAGLVVAGVGAALNMVSWLTTKVPEERDIIRYHVKFESKNNTALEFYPFVFSKNTHKEGTPIDMGSFREAEKMLFSSFLAWNALGGSFNQQIPTFYLEKDLLKATEMAITAK